MTYYKRFSIGQRYGVYIFGEYYAVEHVPSAGSTLIRINSDPTFSPLKYPALYARIIEVSFYDVDDAFAYRNAITSDDAKRIADGLRQHVENKQIDPEVTLVVHCQGGISRSTGVACAYAAWQRNLGLEEDIRQSGFAVPNTRVYRMVLEELMDGQQEERYKEIG